MSNLNDPNVGVVSNKGECRICHQEDELDGLISPCQCIGSMKYIHFDCFVDCIKAKNSPVCDVCRGQPKDFRILFVKRSFWEFLQLNPDIREELAFVFLLIILLQLSLMLQTYVKETGSNKLTIVSPPTVSLSTAFWYHLVLQVFFISMHFIYTFATYQQWAKKHLKVKDVLRIVTKSEIKKQNILT